MKKLLAFMLALIFCFSLLVSCNLPGGEQESEESVCGGKVMAEDLMATVVANPVSPQDNVDAHNYAAADFAIRLFKVANEEGKSTLVSPVSVLYALAMAANGAKGETRAQMEETLGMSVEELNLYLYTYMQNLPQGEKYKLNIANSVWFTSDQRFTVNQSFLQTNADYYGADVYKAPFDEQTLADINSWVNYQTDGLIPSALDEIPEEALMYIINAILFDAEWESPYNEYSVYDGKFTKEDGRELDMEMMRSEESRYLEDESSTGFIKYYDGRKYAFAAILPNEGISVSEYLATLDGERLSALLSGSRGEVVYATMPKFESGSDFEMAEILMKMGIVDAFSSAKADFSGLGESSAGNICISRVIHKTFIEVGEKGTRAGAVTIIEATDECAPMDPKTVKLDRPFIYMLIDCENNIPLFIGTMMGD